jgi:hypothetical protein
MECGIIDDQSLSWFETRNQTGFNPDFKDASIASAFNRKRGHQLTVAVGCDHIVFALT